MFNYYHLTFLSFPLSIVGWYGRAVFNPFLQVANGNNKERLEDFRSVCLTCEIEITFT